MFTRNVIHTIRRQIKNCALFFVCIHNVYNIRKINLFLNYYCVMRRSAAVDLLTYAPPVQSKYLNLFMKITTRSTGL